MFKKIKKSQILVLSLIIVMLSGCSLNSKANEGMSGNNPWTESDKSGVLEATGFTLNAPKDASNVIYCFENTEKIGQITYQLDGCEWVYRIKATTKAEDISGMNYEWTFSEEGTVCNRPAVFMSYSDAEEDEEFIDSKNTVQVVNWFDEVTGVSYSLSASGTDLNGMDIGVYAEQIYEPLQS